MKSRLLQHKRHSFEGDRKNAAVFLKKLHRVGGSSCQTKRIYLGSGESGEIHNQNRVSVKRFTIGEKNPSAFMSNHR